MVWFLRGGKGGRRLGIVARNHLLLHVLALLSSLVVSNQAFDLPPLPSRVIYRVIIREFLCIQYVRLHSCRIHRSHRLTRIGRARLMIYCGQPVALLVQHVGAQSQACPAIHGSIVHLGGLSVSLLLLSEPCVRHAVPLRYHRRKLCQIVITLQCLVMLLLRCEADACRSGRYADYLLVGPLLKDFVDRNLLLLCHSILFSQHLRSGRLLGSDSFACALSTVLDHAVAFCGSLVGDGGFVRGEAPRELESRVLLHSARNVVLGGIVFASETAAGTCRSFGAL